MKNASLAICVMVCATAPGCIASVKTTAPGPGHIHFINPEGMHHNPAFSQGVVTHGSTSTVYVGGQNAVDASGTIVGKGDLAAQAKQALANLELVLEAAGASKEDVIKWTIYMVAGQDGRAAHAVFQETWGEPVDPPLVTVVYVAGLAHPDFLIEMEAVAVVPLCHWHDD